MIIVFEGLEGVGKTTLAQSIGNSLSYGYVKTPDPAFNDVRSHVSKMDNPAGRFYFYLSTLFDIQHKILPYKMSRKKHVILDRYILSTVAYHNFGASFETPIFDNSNLVEADITIAIECSDNIRIDRINQRGVHIYEREEFNDKQIANFFKEKCDISFSNNNALENSQTAISNYISEWLLKNV